MQVQQEAAFRLRVATAGTSKELVHVVRDYVAAWPVEDLEDLPPQCRPSAITTPHEVSDAAYNLVRYRCSLPGRPAAEALVEQLASFFSFAAARAAQLTSRAV